MIRNKSFLNILGLTCVGFFLVSCATAQLPTGPNPANLTILTGVSNIAVQVQDNRGTDKIGVIGATTIKAEQEEVTVMVSNLIRNLLHNHSLNSIEAQNISFSTNDTIQNGIEALNADGAVFFTLTSLRVSSVDILLDSPEYVAEGMIVVYNKSGESIFRDYVFGSTNSRALTNKGKGEAILDTFNVALSNLHTNQKFQEAVKSLQ